MASSTVRWAVVIDGKLAGIGPEIRFDSVDAILRFYAQYPWIKQVLENKAARNAARPETLNSEKERTMDEKELHAGVDTLASAGLVQPEHVAVMKDVVSGFLKGVETAGVDAGEGILTPIQFVRGFLHGLKTIKTL